MLSNKWEKSIATFRTHFSVLGEGGTHTQTLPFIGVFWSVLICKRPLWAASFFYLFLNNLMFEFETSITHLHNWFYLVCSLSLSLPLALTHMQSTRRHPVFVSVWAARIHGSGWPMWRGMILSYVFPFQCCFISSHCQHSLASSASRGGLVGAGVLRAGPAGRLIAKSQIGKLNENLWNVYLPSACWRWVWWFPHLPILTLKPPLFPFS